MLLCPLSLLPVSVTHPLQSFADEGSLPRRAVQKGERHSGNNFLQSMLDKNFEQNPEGGGCETSSDVSARHFCCWTHGMASDECAAAFTPPPSVYVLLVRNPYAWLLAMNGEPYEYDGWKSGRLSSFLRAPFSYAPYPMYAGAEHHRHDNPVKLWGAKVAAYLSLRTPKLLLTHDELYDEGAVRAKLELLTTRHGIARRAGLTAVVYPNFTTSAGNNNHNREFTLAEFEAARAYEREQRWASSYSQEDLDFVNSQLDAAHMAELRFEMLTTAPAASPAGIAAAESAAATAARGATARRVAALYAAKPLANRTEASHVKPRSRSLMPHASGGSRSRSTLSLFESRVDSTIDSLLDFMDRVDMPQGMRSFEWV